MLKDESATFRSAMDALAFGRVATYFAHRWSAPTFLSGLSVMGMVARTGSPMIEIACGTGQLLREAANAGFTTVGADVVFAKCWLGHRFISPDTQFVCCDGAKGAPAFCTDEPSSVFCHDAFYFFPDKSAALDGMRQLANGGSVGIGHAHTDKDDTGIAGTPLPLEAYQTLSPNGVFFDDAELAKALIDNCRPSVSLDSPGAVSFVEGEMGDADRFGLPRGRLRTNPLLKQHDGQFSPVWPDDRFAHEYKEAAYLFGEGEMPTPSLPPRLVEVAARKRQLLDLPERW
jgi:hypothetical protein